MITVRLIVRKDRETSQGFPIVLYININNKRLSLNTNLFIKNPEYLNNNKVSKKDPLWSEKNNKLTEILSKTNIVLLENKDIHTIKYKLDELLNNKVRKEKLLIDYIEEYKNTKTHKRTADLYQGTINKICSFDRNVHIEDVDKKWLQDFESFCAPTMSINGYGIHLRNIRAVFNYLLEDDRINHYPFKKFKIKHEDTPHRALSIEQVRLLKDYPCEDFTCKYRDIFMLMLYLIGINPKDLLYLKVDNILEGRITYHRFKTGRLYSIKLEPEAAVIFERYKGKEYLLNFLEKNSDYLEFVRHMNKGLKKIGDYSIIRDKAGKMRKRKYLPLFPGLTSYWARHTWASIAFDIGISKDIISLALGHSNGLKVTDIYIRYDQMKVDEANRKVIDYINKNLPSSQTGGKT